MGLNNNQDNILKDFPGEIHDAGGGNIIVTSLEGIVS
jgi:hypothetical protein